MAENKHILLVEDNLDDERLTLRALRKNNIVNEVVVAGDGSFALDYLFRRGDHANLAGAPLPSLVVLDLGLPGMDGIEVLRQIRASEETRMIPVVVMTSSDDDAKVDLAYRNGASSFVRKPVDPEQFSEAILNMAMYWLLLNVTP